MLELKGDVEECKVGWKRSWARCEREIGELVARRQREMEERGAEEREVEEGK